jgi:steroid 5-alpha reductase family enzyme
MECTACSGPLAITLWLCAAFAFGSWLLSVITKDYSWVDRLWSITPPIYVWIFAAYAGFDDVRLNIMAALATLWGARLTYNFARKGGYKKGGEDYRWEEVKKVLGPRWFQVFNATFIAPYQHLLLLLIVLPAYLAYLSRGLKLTWIDDTAMVAFVFFLIGETLADEQQWRFQSDKVARKARGESVAQNFLTTGLFRYSRHPNFFCEQGMWWSFYLFSVTASGQWLNWTIIGAVLLTLLFQGSTGITEKLSLRKYPEYADYQKVTSRLMPWPPKRA